MRGYQSLGFWVIDYNFKVISWKFEGCFTSYTMQCIHCSKVSSNNSPMKSFLPITISVQHSGCICVWSGEYCCTCRCIQQVATSWPSLGKVVKSEMVKVHESVDVSRRVVETDKYTWCSQTQHSWCRSGRNLLRNFRNTLFGKNATQMFFFLVYVDCSACM